MSDSTGGIWCNDCQRMIHSNEIYHSHFNPGENVKVNEANQDLQAKLAEAESKYIEIVDKYFDLAMRYSAVVDKYTELLEKTRGEK